MYSDLSIIDNVKLSELLDEGLNYRLIPSSRPSIVYKQICEDFELSQASTRKMGFQLYC